MISSFFHVILYQPLYNLMVGLYNILPGHDVGLVILVVTIIIRLIVYPLTSKSIKSQKSLQELQPKMAEIKEKYNGDQQKQAQAVMELYKNNKVNPFASCLPLLIQLPILIALYWVLRDALASKDIANQLYPFISNPNTINPVSLGLFNLQQPNFILAILAGAAQFVQTKMLMSKRPPKAAGSGGKDENMMAMMNKQMLYFMPIMTVVIGISLPAGLTLYWFWSTILMALQQYILMRKDKSTPLPENVIEGKIEESDKK